MKPFLKPWGWAFAGLLLFLGGPVGADIYKYIDESGKPHYTNDASSIPPQYRDSLDREKEVTTPEPEPAVEAGEASTATEKKGQTLEDKREQLRAEGRALNQEAAQLQKAVKRLNAAQNEAQTAAEVMENNRQIEELNQKIESLEKRKARYRQKMEAFNQQVQQRQKAQAAPTAP